MKFPDAKLNPEGCTECQGTGRILLLNFYEPCHECVARRDRLQKQIDRMNDDRTDP